MRKLKKKEDMTVFQSEKIRGFPQSKQKVRLAIKEYNIRTLHMPKSSCLKAQSIHISPYGMEFQVSADYCEGDLLKIEVTIPGYWQRKRHLIDYTRINAPKSFPVIARVISKQQASQRRRKHTFSVQNLSMDGTDEMVLRGFLQESAQAS